MQRRKILAGLEQAPEPKKAKKIGELEFIDEDEEVEQDIEGEIKVGEENNIVKIVVKNLIEKFPENILVLNEVKKILASSQYVDPLVIV